MNKFRDFWNKNEKHGYLPEDDIRQETLLIMALIYLLIKDSGDRELILALVYILL